MTLVPSHTVRPPPEASISVGSVTSALLGCLAQATQPQGIPACQLVRPATGEAAVVRRCPRVHRCGLGGGGLDADRGGGGARGPDRRPGRPRGAARRRGGEHPRPGRGAGGRGPGPRPSGTGAGRRGRAGPSRARPGPPTGPGGAVGDPRGRTRRPRPLLPSAGRRLDQPRGRLPGRGTQRRQGAGPRRQRPPGGPPATPPGLAGSREAAKRSVGGPCSTVDSQRTGGGDSMHLHTTTVPTSV